MNQQTRSSDKFRGEIVKRQGSLACCRSGVEPGVARQSRGHKESDTHWDWTTNYSWDFYRDNHIIHKHEQLIPSFWAACLYPHAFMPCTYIFWKEQNRRTPTTFWIAASKGPNLRCVWGKNKPREPLMHHPSDPRVLLVGRLPATFLSSYNCFTYNA